MTEHINVIKIGGNVIDNSTNLSNFLKAVAEMPGKKIIVHGGGKEATRLSAKLGIETQMIEGRRVTDQATLDIVTMVYSGLLNKNIVAKLQALDCNAIGLTGADGNVIPAIRRKPTPVDYGYVGDIDSEKIDSGFIYDLLMLGKTPVFCAICHDHKGSLLNCNADSVAAAIAIALSKKVVTKLTYCFEKPGVLRDIADENSVVELVTEASFDSMKSEGVIVDGMIPKIQNALESARKGVSEVRICHADKLAESVGTVIRLK